jgi:RNA polymerase sigma-70 factor, ECF subfamily
MVSGEQELALAAASGARDAFAQLVERSYGRVYRLAYRFVGSREDAEDVAQTVCVKLATAIRGFRGEARFATWLHRLTVNAALDHLRDKPPDGHDDQAMLAAESMDAAPDGTVFNQDLWRAVRRLPPQQRDAVLLVYGEDCSHQEAAQALGCAEATVSWHLHEARKALKIQLLAAE